jgi:GntR family transcriptional regulator
MAAQFDVAVGTLRKALASLEDKGLIERRQGSGNYVRRRKDVQSVYAQFRLERPGGGGLPTADVIALTRMPPPDAGRDHGLPDMCLCITRHRRLDDILIAYERIWIAEPSADIDLTTMSESLYAWYRDALGIEVSRVEDAVGVAILPDDTQLGAATEHGSMGFIERRAWDLAGTPVEFSQTWFDPNQARFYSRSGGLSE